MTPEEAAKRLRKAELELQRAQRHHDGSLEAVERYRAAVSELAIAQKIAAAFLSNYFFE
jgi:hypothetical protein